MLGKRLTCTALEPSYNRIVARCRLPDGRDLSCAVQAAGAATRWDQYWRRYGLDTCPSAPPVRSLSSSTLRKRLDFPAVQVKAPFDGDRHDRTLFDRKIEEEIEHLQERLLRDINTDRRGLIPHLIEGDRLRQASSLVPIKVAHARIPPWLNMPHKRCVGNILGHDGGRRALTKSTASHAGSPAFSKEKSDESR